MEVQQNQITQIVDQLVNRTALIMKQRINPITQIMEYQGKMIIPQMETQVNQISLTI